MTKRKIGELEQRLREVEGERELRAALAAEEPLEEELLELLQSRSGRISDAAAKKLREPQHVLGLIRALADGRIRRAEGRRSGIWALNILGRKYPGAAEAYLALIGDKDDVVAENALFGLVFLLEPRAIDGIEAEMSRPHSAERRESYQQALEALKAKDPFKYAPGFSDEANVWGWKDKKHK
ncbi:MAG: hypothetical protein HY901_13295 [Deltaproteobacteria bacterium]|nr:hypothetical protein [Deltaproteobacteria bacterium]